MVLPERSRKDLYIKYILCLFLFLDSTLLANAQTGADTAAGNLSLKDCISYALKNEPAIRQAAIDQEIAEKDIQIRLADWLPQLNIGNTLQHSFIKSVVVFPNTANPAAGPSYIRSGVFNSNALGLTASQSIFSNSLRLASGTARFYRRQARQNTEQVKINLVVNVSKAFYDLLLTGQQVSVLNQDISRLGSNSKEALSQYQAGTNDRIDYEQSRIALNNSISQRFAATESMKSKYAYLRQLMGYPQSKTIQLRYDSLTLTREITVDTPDHSRPQGRIEYQLLQTTLALEKETYSYYKYAFLPNISAFGNYNLINQNDKAAKLFDRNFPNSAIGLSLSLPVFQGNKRIYNMRRAALVLRRSALDLTDLTNTIETEYSQALGTYKSYKIQYALSAQNVEIARHVYTIVKIQYQQGIKPYLNLIQAESDLRTSQLNYLNALFQLLSSKLDVQQALGIIPVQP